MFFDELLVQQKVGQQIAKIRLLAAMGDFPGNFWEGRRVGRCPLELFRAVLESWMNSACGPARSCPGKPEAADIFITYGLPPFPPTSDCFFKLCVIVLCFRVWSYAIVGL